MSQLNKVLNDSRAENIYYDVAVINLQNTTTKQQAFSYIDTRTVTVRPQPKRLHDEYHSFHVRDLESARLYPANSGQSRRPRPHNLLGDASKPRVRGANFY